MLHLNWLTQNRHLKWPVDTKQPLGLPEGLFSQNGAIAATSFGSGFRVAERIGSSDHQVCQKNRSSIVHFGLIDCTVGIELSEKA